MLLVIDIGNSNITAGVYDNSVISNTFRCISNPNSPTSYYENFFQEIADMYLIKECVVGSVADKTINKLIIQSICKVFHLTPTIIDFHSKSDIKINYENPLGLGIDRIANASAAALKYKLPAIVVDLGTATTFEVITENKELIGGIIMPGLNLQLKSLNLNTSALPEISVSESKKAIGNSTNSCVLSGVIRGSASAIEGLIRQCEQELGETATIIATGGYSYFISDYMYRNFDFIDKTLTLDGLKNLYKINTCVCV